MFTISEFVRRVTAKGHTPKGNLMGSYSCSTCGCYLKVTGLRFKECPGYPVKREG